VGQGGDVINILHKEMDAHVTAEGIYARFGVDEQVHLRRRSQKKVAQSIMASNSPTTFWQVRRLRVCLYAIVQVSACVCMPLSVCPRVFVCCRPCVRVCLYAVLHVSACVCMLLSRMSVSVPLHM
jgi:hypothetical protein